MRKRLEGVVWAIRLLVMRAIGWFVVARDSQVRYIGSHEMLPPPPLSLDEETVLMEKLRTGEIYVRSELVERNLRLVVYIARKFESTGVGVEDLVSIGHQSA